LTTRTRGGRTGAKALTYAPIRLRVRLMDTDPSAQTAESEPAPGADASAKRARLWETKPFWSAIRAALFLAAAIGFGLRGYTLRPSIQQQLSVSEPSITVLASSQNVTAQVDMTLTAKASSYSLSLSLTSVAPLAQPVTLAVWFDGFPTPSVGQPLIPSANAYYTTGKLVPASLGAASKPQDFTFKSARPIGEKNNGLELRVAFPDLLGEVPGSQFSYQACGPGVSIHASLVPICKGLGSLSTWYTPVLEAGTTTLSSVAPSLQDYQVLAGDNPTLLGGGESWTWTGVNGVAMLAANVPAENNQQNDLFYSGVFLGVAAGAVIAFFTELLRPLWSKD